MLAGSSIGWYRNRKGGLPVPNGCGCCFTHHLFKCCPQEARCTCSRTVVLKNICPPAFPRCRECPKERICREIPVGEINICCLPSHYQSPGQVETIAACGASDGYLQPTTLIPFNPTPFIRSVPPSFTPTGFYTTYPG